MVDSKRAWYGSGKVPWGLTSSFVEPIGLNVVTVVRG